MPRLHVVATRPPEVPGFTTAGRAVGSLPISKATRGPVLAPAVWAAIVLIAMTLAWTFGVLLALKLTGGI